MNNIVESAGVGVTLLDYDGDGKLDIYAVNGAHLKGVSEGPAPSAPPRNRLYRNLGGIRFEEVTEETAAAAGEAAADGAKPLSQTGYKVKLIAVAVKRALLTAAGAKKYWEV